MKDSQYSQTPFLSGGAFSNDWKTFPHSRIEESYPSHILSVDSAFAGNGTERKDGLSLRAFGFSAEKSTELGKRGITIIMSFHTGVVA